MKIKQQRKLTYITTGLVGAVFFAAILLSGSCPKSSEVSATVQKNATTTASIQVSSSCSMTATTKPGEEHTANILNGHYQDGIGITTIQTFCNDPEGYSIYAIGYTGENSGIENGTNTVLTNDRLGHDYDIPTNTLSSGDDYSGWSMKLTAVDSVVEDVSYDIYKPTILNGYDNYSVVPASYTRVASFDSNTDVSGAIGSSLTTTYAAYIKPTQPAGAYNGKVKYVLVHPSYGPIDGTYYMQDVAIYGDSIPVGQEVTAVDARDGKTYTIRRMCTTGTGDNCTKENSILWMTQNLDLDLSNQVALSSEDTDLKVSGSGIYYDGYSEIDGTIYWTPAQSTASSINTSIGSFSNYIYSSTQPASADPDGGSITSMWYETGERFNSGICVNENCNYLKSGNTLAQTYFAKTPFASNGEHGRVGNYYNLPAAIATNALSYVATGWYQNSICPSGWEMPHLSDFRKLNAVYNASRADSDVGLTSAPVYMTRAGNLQSHNGQRLNSAGYSGGYLSSTQANVFTANVFYINSNLVGGTDDLWEEYADSAFSVRCVSNY